MKLTEIALAAAAVVGVGIAVGAVKKSGAAPATAATPYPDLFAANTTQSSAINGAVQQQWQQDLNALAQSDPNWWAA